MSRQKPQSPQEYWSEWLVDAVAASTQDRRFLRGDDECDEQLCEALLHNGRKAIDNASKANEAKLRGALFSVLGALDGLNIGNRARQIADQAVRILAEMYGEGGE